MNLVQLFLLGIAAVLVGAGLVIAGLKRLAMGRAPLEPFEIVGLNAISVGFVGMAAALVVVVVL